MTPATIGVSKVAYINNKVFPNSIYIILALKHGFRPNTTPPIDNSYVLWYNIYYMRVLVKSLYDTFDYVMEHYYPFGLEEFAEKRDTYAIISIQDSHTGGFGVHFAPNHFCKDVLTLLIDDTVKEVDGAVLFNETHARRIIDFIKKNRDKVDTLVIHCYAGQSRSAAVGAFAMEYLGQDSSDFIQNHRPNPYILKLLREFNHAAA